MTAPNESPDRQVEVVATTDAPIELLSVPVGWPYRNRQSDPLPAELPVPDVAAITNPVEGGGITVLVRDAELRSRNEIQATLALTIDITNDSLTETIYDVGYGPLDIWCRFPATSAGNGYAPNPEYSTAPETPSSIEPLQTITPTPLVYEIDLPLDDCDPVVTLELNDSMSGLATGATVADDSGRLALVLPVDLGALVAAAAPVPDEVPSVLAMCALVEPTLSDLYPDAVGLVRDPSQPCAWETEAGEPVLWIDVDAAFGPLEVNGSDLNWVPADDLAPGAVYGVWDEGSAVNLNAGGYKLKVAAYGDEQISRTLFRLISTEI